MKNKYPQTEPEYLCKKCLEKYKSSSKIDLEGPLDQFSDTCDRCGQHFQSLTLPLFFVTQ